MFVTNRAPELGICPEEYLEQLKTICSLADSGDEWYRALDDHMQIDLKMTPIVIDPSLYCQFEDYRLVGIHGNYVYDLL